MSGSGNYLGEFADFVAGTGPTYIDRPRELLVQARKHRYPFSEMCYGDGKEMVRGGSSINQAMIFQGNGTGRKYKPGERLEWDNPQRLQKAQTWFRRFIVHKSWVDDEILLNDAIRYGNERARFDQYVRIDNEKEAMMWIETWEKLDSYLFLRPDYTTMEGENVLDHMSLFAINNEEDNGLFGTEASDPWTTVFGLSPTAAATQGKWKPARQGYGSIADAPGATSLTTDSLIPALDELFEEVMFAQPRKHSEWWEDDGMRSMQIWTTKRGLTQFKTALRNGQDHWIAGPQDPAYPHPTMRGIPLIRVDDLETASVYYDATGTPNYTTEGTVAEGGATTAWYSDSDGVAHHPGPRYYLWNFNYTFPVFQDQRFFFKKKPSQHHNVPDTWVVPMTLWHQIFCVSRQHNGVLFPNATGLAY
jgi:hypothetical protein